MMETFDHKEDAFEALKERGDFWTGYDPEHRYAHPEISINEEPLEKFLQAEGHTLEQVSGEGGHAELVDILKEVFADKCEAQVCINHGHKEAWIEEWQRTDGGAIYMVTLTVLLDQRP